MSEQDLNELRELAEAAKQVQDNPAFQAAVSETQQAILNEWINTPSEAKEKREHLYAKFLYGQQFMQNIDAILKNYDIALLHQQNSEQLSM
nr:hypothetical protein [uncultured Mediterranean phage uvMED]